MDRRRPAAAPPASCAGHGCAAPVFAEQVGEGEKSREILLLSNPIHTDIALPVDDDLRRVFAELQEGGIAVNHPAAAYLVFGWGGRSFYIQTPTWADLKPMPVLRSFTLDSSVMHVDVTGDFPADLAGVKRLRISEVGYQRLVAGIRASFAGNDDGVSPVPGAGYGLTDAFSRRMASSMRSPAVTRGQPRCCGKRAFKPVGGRPCRRCCAGR